MVCTTHVFADRGTRAGGDARPYNPIGTGAKYAAERIRIVTHDMMRGGYRYTYVILRPAQWRTGDGAPYWRDAQIRPAQIIHVAQIPAAYTPLAP